MPPWRVLWSGGYRYAAWCIRCNKPQGFATEKYLQRHLADLEAAGFVVDQAFEKFDPGDGNTCTCGLDASKDVGT